MERTRSRMRRLALTVFAASLLGMAVGSASPARAQIDAAIVAAAATSSDDARFTDPQVKLLTTGRFNRVDIINAYAVTPTLIELLEYDAVITWSNLNYQDHVALGEVLADYVDQGGGVVVAVFANSTTTSGRSLGGRWQDNPDYEVIVPRRGNRTGQASLGIVHEPDHPTMEGVASFDGGSSSFRPDTMDLYAGCTLIAEWSDGVPLVAEGRSPSRIDLGFYPPSSDVSPTWWDSSTDGGALLANALIYAARGRAGPRLTVTGACPGTLTLTVTSASPDGSIAYARAFGTGQFVIPGPICNGVELGLDSTVQLIGTVRADQNGEGSLSGNAPSVACGRVFVQALDVNTCAVSNVEGI